MSVAFAPVTVSTPVTFRDRIEAAMAAIVAQHKAGIAAAQERRNSAAASVVRAMSAAARIVSAAEALAARYSGDGPATTARRDAIMGDARQEADALMATAAAQEAAADQEALALIRGLEAHAAQALPQVARALVADGILPSGTGGYRWVLDVPFPGVVWQGDDTFGPATWE